MIMLKNVILVSVSILSLIVSSVSRSQQINHTDPVTGIKSWSISSDGVSFSLTQILPVQAQAFYVNRGFTLEQIKEYATSCVYMTVLRNDTAASSIHYVSNEWTIIANRQLHRLLSVNEWLETLQKQKVNKPSLIAFEWAQFPPENEYEPGGDWNQGMLSVGLKASEEFDITAHWYMKEKKFSAKLEGVQCAK